WQVPGPAILPLWRVKQSRMDLDAPRSRLIIPAASDVSCDPPAPKTNARSLLMPSPLMSPATIGVNGTPDENRPTAPTVRREPTDWLATSWKMWRDTSSLSCQSSCLGSPLVVPGTLFGAGT